MLLLYFSKKEGSADIAEPSIFSFKTYGLWHNTLLLRLADTQVAYR
jgi:hypothetical protein